MTGVRVADEADAPAVTDLHLRTALTSYAHIFPPEAPPPDHRELLREWRGWLQDRDPRVFVWDDGAITGVVMANADTLDGVGRLSRLYVDPARWGQGIGRALHDRCLDHLRAAGHRTARLWVLEANGRARAWYERLGWQLTNERIPTYEPAGIYDVSYSLDLR